MELSIEFEPDTVDEAEEARRQRICNLTDKHPALGRIMNGKTWRQIYALKMDRADH